MKVTSERLPQSQVALDIELEPQQVQKGLEKAARKLSQQFRIPGFRPGKAPRQIVENYFGRDRLLEEATDDLIQKSFPEALKQENITPVGRPQLESVEQEPFRYRVTVPVEPAVELADYSGYELPFEPEPVTDETVQKLLDAQREQHVVLKELEEARAAQANDMVTVLISSDDEDEDEDDATDEDEDGEFDASVELDEEIEADEDEDEADGDNLDDESEVAELDRLDADEDELDEAEEAAEGREQQIALVEGRVRPEIFEALVGAQVGETRTATVSYGEDEEDETLRGREVSYTMQVKNVQERLLPDWEELPTLAEFPGDFDAMRANARERLEHAADDKSRRELIEAFLNRLSEETPFEIPEAMIHDRATELFHQQVSEFQRYGISEDQFLKLSNKTHDEAVAEFMGQAEPDVRRSLVVRELIRREGLTIDDADLAAENERFLQDFGPERRDEVRQMLQQPNMRQMVASSALDRKLRDHLVSLATGGRVGPAKERQEPRMSANSPTPSEGEQPEVQSDIATGGVTENSVFEDAGADMSAETGRSSVEQATVGDYGQQRASEEQTDDGSARANEA